MDPQGSFQLYRILPTSCRDHYLPSIWLQLHSAVWPRKGPRPLPAADAGPSWYQSPYWWPIGERGSSVLEIQGFSSPSDLHLQGGEGREQRRMWCESKTVPLSTGLWMGLSLGTTGASVIVSRAVTFPAHLLPAHSATALLPPLEVRLAYVACFSRWNVSGKVMSFFGAAMFRAAVCFTVCSSHCCSDPGPICQNDASPTLGPWVSTMSRAPGQHVLDKHQEPEIDFGWVKPLASGGRSHSIHNLIYTKCQPW